MNGPTTSLSAKTFKGSFGQASSSGKEKTCAKKQESPTICGAFCLYAKERSRALTTSLLPATGLGYLVYRTKKNASSTFRSLWGVTYSHKNLRLSCSPQTARRSGFSPTSCAFGTVASLMGHSSPQMLLNHYQYILSKQKTEAVSKLLYVTFYVTH